MNDQKRGEENLRELLKERTKIDELLQDRFSKEMTIVFTDIKGSTTYFESRGDINGLSMVYKHNEMLFPIIEHHQGTIIKTIGDSIMASFPDPIGGIRAAIEMQQKLLSYNAKHPKQDHIRIRIGLNAGRGIVENRDVFGDIVNVAARIESLAEPGQILVSQTVYEAVRQTDDIICRYFDCTKVKGKEEAIELYRVIWSEEEITLGSKGVLKSFDLGKWKQYLKKVIPLGIGAFLLIALILGVVVERGKLGKRGEKSDPYQLAYQQLKEGRLEEARESFNRMKPEDVLRFEGLAAIYFKTEEYEKSLIMCERVLKANQENLYSHVIKGNIFLNQGKIDDAALEYDKATQLTQGADWQRAEAYNRLGRIYAAQHRVKEAMSLYAQAAKHNPNSPEIYSNQGVLSERAGNLSQAILLYKKALEVKPQDTITMVLLEEAKNKKQLAEDREKTQRIDRLVSELIKTYQEKKETGLGAEEDKWTSKTLTLSFLDFQKRGIPSNRDGEDEYLLLELTSKLQEKGRIHIVERALLNKLLEELKLSSSDLANPELALRVGRIAAARLIATGSFTRYGRDIQVALRLIETETTAVKVTIVESIERKMGIDAISEKLAQRIIKKLKVHYPLRGKIISIKGEELILNIGADQGVETGITMKILAEMKPVQLKERRIIPKGREIGKLEITSVEPALAYASIIEKNGDIKIGFKVEELTVQRKQGTGSRVAGNSEKIKIEL